MRGFCQSRDAKATQIHPHRAREPLEEEASSATYAELTIVIHSTLLCEIEKVIAPEDDVQFSAQDISGSWSGESAVVYLRPSFKLNGTSYHVYGT